MRVRHALVIATTLGVVVITYMAAGRFFGDDRMYSLAVTRECLQRVGREVRSYPQNGGFPTIGVGPFDNGAPDEPTDVLEFAPTPDAADDAKYRGSDATARKGNVLSPSGFSDPVVERCLDEAKTRG